MRDSGSSGLHSVAAAYSMNPYDRPVRSGRNSGPQRLVAVRSDRPEPRVVPDGPRVDAGMGQVYSGPDPGAMQRAVGERVAPYRLRVIGRDPFQGRLSVARGGDVVVATLTFDVAVQADLETLSGNAYLVTLVGTGSAALVDGGPAEVGSHVVGPGQRVQQRWAAGQPVTVIRLSRRLVERVWRDQGGRTPATPLRFAVPLNPSAARSGVWQALADAFVATRDSGLLAKSASANACFGRLLAQTLLNLQPHARPQPVPDPLVEAPHRAGSAEADGVLPVPAPVLRALDFCRAHAHEQLTVARIADAAGVSVRRLQATFRIHVGVTPIEYVTQLRLAGVHADLKRIADGTVQETVTDAALRWGFAHLGRFSRTYRAEFGRLPSQTARNESPPERE